MGAADPIQIYLIAKNSKKNLQPLGQYAYFSDYKDARVKIIYNTQEDIFFAFKVMKNF